MLGSVCGLYGVWMVTKGDVKGSIPFLLAALASGLWFYDKVREEVERIRKTDVERYKFIRMLLLTWVVHALLLLLLLLWWLVAL